MNSEFQINQTTQATATGQINAPGVVTSSSAPLTATPAVEVDVGEVSLRDRVHWGPIVAGVVAAFAMLLFLTMLGIALGINALSGDSPATWGTAAGIWGGLSLLVAFFFGGWMSSRSATTIDEHEGPLNGFITGAATLLVLVWLTTTAITGALGFFATTIANIAGAAAPTASQNAGPGAWGTTIVIALAIAAATAGGMAGQNPRWALPRTRSVVASR